MIPATPEEQAAMREIYPNGLPPGSLNAQFEQSETAPWHLTNDLITSLTIDNIPQSLVGKVLDAIREAGLLVEINVGPKP